MLNFAGWQPTDRGPKLLPDEALGRQRMRAGLRALCRLTKRDFGYDLAAWHAYLKGDEVYRHP
jgi:hypothetical protein